ncbi:sigma-70 family RNA polymerase sigma factor [Tautonia sociabilis]|uniref:RNA polymerase sigma factor RpoD/SigA n=1 Tax=Tautonia sociabilis TaxID=2080755 RepID=A0A432MK17_9BACT|nr:RNA polymerase sigma factor RpoD/SigA [Tautonia sociabilis]RUL87466.1 RNA polymerase sigma factor RpoD/SigA [Tautonia sociabilis]
MRCTIESTRASAGPGCSDIIDREAPGGSTTSPTTSVGATPLGPYFREIRDESLLTAEQERALAEAIARGDEEARARLIRANLRLVVKIARGFRGRGLALEDLVGEGNLGLIRAASGFDPSFGTRFSTYASHWIKESIRRALGTTTAPIRLPSYMIGLLARWRDTERELLRRDGRPPTPEEVAEELGLNPARRRMVEQALQAGRFLAGGGPEEPSPLLEEATVDGEGPEEAIEGREQLDLLRRRLGRLDEREHLVLSLSFGLDGGPPQNLSAIGRRLGVSREWVRQIMARAVRKLDDRGVPDVPPAAHRRRKGDRRPETARSPLAAPAARFRAARCSAN